MPSDAPLASTAHAPSLRRMAPSTVVLLSVATRAVILSVIALSITHETTRNGLMVESMLASLRRSMLAASSVRASCCDTGKYIPYLRRGPEANHLNSRYASIIQLIFGKTFFRVLTATIFEDRLEY